MSSDAPPETPTPCRGRITEFGVDRGSIETEHGTTVRFGNSSCSGLTPEVGLEVWVMALRRYPVVGERATLVNLTGAQEPADPAERARLRNDKRLAEQQAEQNAKAAGKAKLRLEAAQGAPPAGWSPSLLALSEVLELPGGLLALAKRPSELDPPTDAPDELGLSIADAARIADAVEEADHTPRIRFGPAEPWPFFPPDLVPFAQVTGEEPDVYAIGYRPDRDALPVWYVRHDDEPELIADDALAFLAALLDGRLDVDGDPIAARPELAAALDLPAPKDLRRPKSGPLETDAAYEALVDAELADDAPKVFELAQRVEASYRERDWSFHADSIRWQLLEYLED